MIKAVLSTAAIFTFIPVAQARAADIAVAHPSELAAALAGAAPGDSLLLAPGSYGSLVFKGRAFSPALKIEAADPAARPQFSAMKLSDLSGVHFANLDVIYGASAAPRTSNVISIKRGGDISFADMTVVGAPDGNPNNDASGVNVRDAHNVTIEGSTFHDLFRGVVTFDSDNTIVRGSVFRSMASDGVTGRGADGVIIENNLFTDFHLSTEGVIHPDAVQFWDSGAARANQHIVIRGNLVLRGAGDPAQGVFIKSASLHSEDILIEHNVIHQSMLQGVFLENVKDARIRNNTVAAFEPGADNPGIEVRGGAVNVEVTDNLLVSQRIAGAQTVSNNVMLEYANPWLASFAGDMLAVPYAGVHARPVDFTPLSASGARDYVRRIGSFDREPPLIADALLDNDPQAMRFFLSGDAAGSLADWSYAAPDGGFETGASSVQADEKIFSAPGLWRVMASVRQPGPGGLDEIVAAEKIIRVFPKMVLDLTFPGAVQQNEAEPSPIEGQTAGFTASPDGGAAVFNGLPVSGGGKFLMIRRAATFSGAPRLKVQFRLRRPSAATGWQRLATLPGAFDIRVNGDRLRFLAVNEAGQSTVLSNYNAGVSDGAWHDVAFVYDGEAGQLSIEIDGAPAGVRPAPGGLMAFKKNQTLYLGGAPWNNTFAGEIETIMISR